MELRHQAALARRWWWLVLLASLVLGATGAWTQLGKPAAYQSRVTLYMSSGRSQNVPVNQMSNLAVQQLQNYSQLIGSDKLAIELRKDTGIDLPASRIAGAMTASLHKDTVLMDVNTTLPEADQARAISEQLPKTLTRVAQELGGDLAKGDFKTSFTIVDGPGIGQVRSTPKLLMATLLGLALGAAFGIAVANLLVRLSRGLRTPGELHELSGRRVVGILARSDKDTERAEGLQRLATTLTNPNHDRHVVAVAGIDRAATGVAQELALAIASQGERVLLVPTRTGLDLSSAEGLDVLADAELPSTAQQWRNWSAPEGYQRIVLAAGSALDNDDIAALRRADSTAVVARQRTTRRDDVTAAVAALDAAGVNDVLAVMDEVDPRQISRTERLTGVLIDPDDSRASRASH